MRRTSMLLAALAFTAGFATNASSTPALDAAGKCRDHGKFVAAAMCEAAAPSGKCRNATTKKFAKCGAPGTEPVPAKK